MSTGASSTGLSPWSVKLLCLLLGTTSLTVGPLAPSALADEDTTAEVMLEDLPEAVVTEAVLKDEPEENAPGDLMSFEGASFEGVLSGFPGEQTVSVEVATESIAVESVFAKGASSEGTAAEGISADVDALLTTPTAGPTEEMLAQVTSVSELDDVRPTDWAYTALARLVEEYGCIEGYPDRTFRGNRAMSRYEFAAGLNACLDVITFTPGYTQDLEIIQRLQEEFAVELAEIRDRIDPLEADVAELQANQFSTTTKLSGIIFAHLNGAFADGDVLAEGTSVFTPARDPVTLDPVIRTITDDPEVTFSYLTWLNFNTSFTGVDRLAVQFVVGDGSAPANTFASAGLFNTFGTPFTLQTGGIGEDNVIIREVFYTFPVGNKLSFTVGPRVNWYRHFDNNRFTFLVTGANSFNSSGGTQVNAIDRGAGVVGQWDIADWLDLRVGYLSEDTEFIPDSTSSDPDLGLFGGTNTLTAQLGVYPTDNLNLRFLYTRTNFEPNAAGFVGGAVSEPIYGFIDDGFGGPLDDADADTFLFNFDWLVTDWLGLFGRYSYGSTNADPATPGLDGGDVNAQSVQLGLAFPDLFKQGALATISYVQPFDVLDGREFLISGGGDGAIQREWEVSYRLPLTDNIALVPSAYWILNPNNFEDNPDIFVFNLQTQFSF
ncbi:MAG: iron uptake porin [Cyanobacteria bacterium P01_D01_bin.44]